MIGALSKVKYREARATSLIMLSKTDRVGVLSEMTSLSLVFISYDAFIHITNVRNSKNAQ